jgi:hypothetical protein
MFGAGGDPPEHGSAGNRPAPASEAVGYSLANADMCTNYLVIEWSGTCSPSAEMASCATAVQVVRVPPRKAAADYGWQAGLTRFWGQPLGRA